MLDVIEEEWKEILDFESYHISNLGRVYNLKRDSMMSTSRTFRNHLKITLQSPWNGRRHTRSVARLVAEAFVESPNILCDTVLILDGDFENVAAHNLVWRPRWYVWKYTHQLDTPFENQHHYFRNLKVCNIVTGVVYDSIMQAGMSEGLLFADIWRSTYTGDALFPYSSIFEIVK